MSFGSWGFKSPLAHAVAFSYPQTPRRRRRGVWLLAILSVVVVGVVLVTTFRSERRILANYLDSAQQAAGLADVTAAEFEQLVGRLDAVTRQEFITAMVGIRTDAAAAGAALEGVEVPEAAAAADARLQLAIDSWNRGLELAEGGILDAADRPEDDVPSEVVERGWLELAVGDRSYESAVTALIALETEADVEFANYPSVQFGVPGTTAADLLDAARGSELLASELDLAVLSVGFEPRLFGENEAGAGVLPFTERIIVNFTVLNQGNDPLTNIPLQVLLAADRSGTGASEQGLIERLDPGESTSLEYLFDVAPFVDYELVINAGAVGDEGNIENNLYRQAFVVNPEG